MKVESIRKFYCKLFDEPDSYREFGEEHKSMWKLSLLTWILIYGFCIGRIFYGMADANKESKCVIRSINDVILSPMYALGCNLAKNRWNKKLN